MIHIQEVVTRDGLQNEREYVPTEKKIELINRISQTGVNKIEVTSFVSPKAVPNLKDAEEVMKNIDRNPDVTYTTLIPNLKGAQRAVECEADEVNLLVSASNTHNLKNVKKTTEDTFESFKEIIDYLSDKNIALSGALGTSFGCPFEGNVPEERILDCVQKYIDLGVNRITLADTTGMATPKQVYELSSKVLDEFPNITLTLHFHNTRGMGLANVLEGIRAGVIHFDASLGGIGGCPFAPGASGNICSEDLVHMLHFMDYELNVDLDKMIETSKYLQTLLSHPLDGQIINAGKITDLHSVDGI
ncbi:hydroxymethylglutaryl-CoA lyase [Alkalibacillus salilacus]|uniref:Hydroxymethylglutaryl-CoA lyase n=1 Tax=Alkalibacillus salilacus TaxID=284582 RepID=A0ABT9VB09_9BACI|nr:hydroxymethylglutaryl-CoA lyase [Alkalibacillus salilacus]MDQ0158155.1 hydroxymethylglutaryl-CoA lyase [Alkalibacillus salilacus]